MTQTELINLAKTQRIPRQPHSLHDTHNPIECSHPRLRTIVCDSDWDVVECPICGIQLVIRCNFDDEYA